MKDELNMINRRLFRTLKGHHFWARLLLLGLLLSPAAVTADIEIDGTRLYYTNDTHYCTYIKFLVVPPDSFANPLFDQCPAQIAVVKSWEDPIRREIFDNMDLAFEVFGFPNIDDARYTFNTRMNTISNMDSMNSDDIPFRYRDLNSDPQIPTKVVSTLWHLGAEKTFEFELNAGVSAYDGIQDLLAHEVRGECAGAMVACVLKGAADALQKPAFDAIHPVGSLICGFGPSWQKHRTNNGDRSMIVPGDQVYLKNKTDYFDKADDAEVHGMWSGCNLIYMGDSLYSCLGLDREPMDSLKAYCKRAYIKDTKMEENELPWPEAWDDSIKVTRIKRIWAKLPAGANKTSESRPGDDPVPELLTTEYQQPVAYTFSLQQNHPNPFNPNTWIDFSVDSEQSVDLSIYDITGHLIQRLVSRKLNPGLYCEEWDGRDVQGREVASGVYFLRLKAGDRVLTKKMVLLE